LSALDQRREQRLLGRDRDRARDAEPEREQDHDPSRGESGPREDGERRGQQRGGRLRDEQEPPTVEAVGPAAGPGREREDGNELAEIEHAEQERGVCEPVDQQRGGEVLEPPAARRKGVAGEVRPEVPLADQGERCGRSGRAHSDLLSALLPAMQSFWFPG
jgi:hypothetical protein